MYNPENLYGVEVEHRDLSNNLAIVEFLEAFSSSVNVCTYNMQYTAHYYVHEVDLS